MQFVDTASQILHVMGDMTQGELSRRTGINRASIASMVTGRMWPRPEQLRAIEKATQGEIRILYFAERHPIPGTAVWESLAKNFEKNRKRT